MAIFGISDMVYWKQWYFYKYQIEMHLIYIKKVAQYKFPIKICLWSISFFFFVWIKNRNSSHNSARPQTLSLALMASTTHNQPTHKP